MTDLIKWLDREGIIYEPATAAASKRRGLLVSMADSDGLHVMGRASKIINELAQGYPHINWEGAQKGTLFIYKK